MISYEVSISLTVIPIILLSSSLNLNEIVIKQSSTLWFVMPLLPLSVIFFISILAETNRAPFDLPEAEAELVAGYNVEYSAIAFAAFFLGEYANILLMSSLFVIFFFGGGLSPLCFFRFSNSLLLTSLSEELLFSLKTIIVTFLFIFIRANLPRFRFDQLIFIGWKIFLPLTLSFIFLFSGILISTNSLDVIQTPNALSSDNYVNIFSIRF
jgi:NADH-quinone oxidoreductase subunit H